MAIKNLEEIEVDNNRNIISTKPKDTIGKPINLVWFTKKNNSPYMDNFREIYDKHYNVPIGADAFVRGIEEVHFLRDEQIFLNIIPVQFYRDRK